MRIRGLFTWLVTGLFTAFPAAGLKEELFLAAGRGQAGDIRYLLDHGAPLDDKDDSGRTPLEVAADEGHANAVQILIQRGASVRTKDAEGLSPLLRVVNDRSKREVVHLLLEAGADPNVADKEGTPALFLAMQAGAEMVQSLLDHGAKPDFRGRENDPALLAALRIGDDDLAKRLIDRGADVNFRAENGDTPITVAAKEAEAATVALLADLGADVETKNADGETPLILCCYGGRTKVARVLLDRGADVNRRHGQGHTALTIAARSGSLDLVKLLVERGSGARIRDASGWTPTLIAAWCGYDAAAVYLHGVTGGDFPVPSALDGLPHEKIMERFFYCAFLDTPAELKELADRGADPRDTGPNNLTALMLAAACGKTDNVRFLLDRGADVNAADGDGSTALMYAAGRDRDEIVRLLLEKGADPTMKNRFGNPAFLWAARNGSARAVVPLLRRTRDREEAVRALFEAIRCRKPEVVQAILAAGLAPVDAVDADGDPALVKAVKLGEKPLVDVILSHGPTLDRPGRDGYSALGEAFRWSCNSRDLVRLLLDRGVRLGEREKKSTVATLMLAWREGDDERARLLLAAGTAVPGATADDWSANMSFTLLNEGIPGAKNLLKHLPEEGGGPDFGAGCLQDIIESGDADLLAWALEKARCSKLPGGDSPAARRQWFLCTAAGLGRPEAVAGLVDRGADPNAAGPPDTAPPLVPAVRSGYTGTVLRLLEKGAKVDTVYDGDNLLRIAIRGDQEETALALLEHGAGPAGDGPGEPSFLAAAAEARMGALARRMLKLGWDPNGGPGDRRSTPLALAVRNQDLDLVHVLLAAGADPCRNQSPDEPDAVLENASTDSLRRALEPAVRTSRARKGLVMIKALLDGHWEEAGRSLRRGADPGAADEDGRPVLFYAVDAGAPAGFVRELLARGADASFRDPETGDTALHRACSSCNTELARLLLPYVRPILENREGRTPLDLARDAGCEDLARLLKGK
ncbi:MAG: ankyrin repeat domain-containing protein [Acidobacteria bacterium]|nr:ankyrin repeat domain-containing protein [Acidobacteriota bacterium]